MTLASSKDRSPLYSGQTREGQVLFEHAHLVGKDVFGGEMGTAQLRLMRTRVDATDHNGASSLSELVLYLRRWKTGLLTMRTTLEVLRHSYGPGRRPPGYGKRRKNLGPSPHDFAIVSMAQAEEKLRSMAGRDALTGREPNFFSSAGTAPCPACHPAYRLRYDRRSGREAAYQEELKTINDAAARAALEQARQEERGEDAFELVEILIPT